MLLVFRQFLLLIWKGLVLRKRHYIVTIIETLIPLVFVLFFVYLRTVTGSSSQDKEQPAQIFAQYDPIGGSYATRPTHFFYAPNNTFTNKLTSSVAKKLEKSFSNMPPIVGFDSEGLLYSEAMGAQMNTSYSQIYAVVYQDLPASGDPKNLKYKIRINNDFQTSSKYMPFSGKGPGHADRDYTYYGFLALQAAIDQAYIEQKAPSASFEVTMQTYAYPPFYYTDTLLTLFTFIPMMIIYSFSIMVTVFVKRVVVEKLNRAKEMMRMMGLNDFVYFFGTFCNTFMVMAIILSLTIIVFKIPVTGEGQSVITYADGFLVWILFMLYAVNALLFCMTISVFFNKPVVAAIVTYILWSTTYSLPRFLMDPPAQERTYSNLALSSKLATCLLPNTALHWACRVMSFYEGTGEGSSWKNMNTPAPGDNLSLAGVMGMMVLSAFLYAFVIWYVDNVWPWQFGIPKHPLYIFMPSYWMPRKVSMQKYRDNDELNNEGDKTYFEQAPEGKTPGISITNLSKEFGWGRDRKVAVNKVTLNMYKGQITALLGHNGAGKTTTLNVITGLYAPSNGTAVVNGCDILDNLKGARSSLGLCPQHNVLYETLTVEEHLTFFAGLKGRTFQEIKQEITSCLALLQLENKRNDLAKTLSGGMKRKLSLGIAMIGGSEVLILDEPTSGMDPQARRAIWDLLQHIREQRTIILTTHYMEEADILGDRIAIMADGAVQCCGSPLFLKRKFGAGYHLRVSKGDNFDLGRMTEMIKASVPTAYLETDMRSESSFVLPIVDSAPFISLFQDLEESKAEIGYTSCGLSITTMEDVFIKVGQMSEKAMDKNIFDWDPQSFTTGFEIKMEDRLRGFPLWLQQVRGLLTKRFHDSKRYWVFLVFLIFLPLAILFLMLFVRNTVDVKRVDITPLLLDLREVFGQTEAYLSRNGSGEESLDPYVDNFQAALREAKATPKVVPNVLDTVLGVGQKSLQTYMTKLLVGGAFEQEGQNRTFSAMYSGQAYHTSAMTLNLMNVAILRGLTADGAANIRVTNAPFPSTTEDTMQGATLNELSSRLIFTFFLPLALSFLSASFVLFPIHERVTKSKLIQLMTGVGGMTFWVTHFLWDFLMHFLSSCFMIIPFVVMDTKNVYTTSTNALGTLFLMLLLYGWSSIPLTYLLSFASKTSSTGFSFASGVNFVTGMILTVSLTVFKLVKVMEAKEASGADSAAWLFRLLPGFAMTWGTANLDAAGQHNVQCRNLEPSLLNQICRQRLGSTVLQICCKDICGDMCFKEKSFFSTEADSCSNDMIFMFATGFLFFMLLAAVETNWIRFWYRFWDRRNKDKTGLAQVFTLFGSGRSQGEDADVSQERLRVEHLYQEGLWRNEALAVLGLKKTFGNIDAVDHLTFSVHKDECFGLLGVNGAGKTTTFSMLTGDLTIGQGNAMIGSYSVKDNLKQFQKHVGYCPQFDAILDRLSGREALFLFARLRGVPEDSIPSVVAKLIEIMDLLPHADKTADSYSGGNRRKLSLAMSLVGSPPVVFLDEPTAGVDPASRRKIWNALSRVQATGGTSFILTTHSMEECEALCGRLAIMVNGQFRCLGGVQYLKNKFGQGYTIIVKLKKEQHLDAAATEAVKQFILKAFPGSLLKDEHQGMLHYHIVDVGLSWSQLFKEMELAKATFDLEDYLISDTSLEQIFLAFARTQRIVSSP